MLGLSTRRALRAGNLPLSSTAGDYPLPPCVCDLNARVWESELKPLWHDTAGRRRNETVPGMVMLMLALVNAGSARGRPPMMPFKDSFCEQQFSSLSSCAARNARTALRGPERDDSHRHAAGCMT